MSDLKDYTFPDGWFLDDAANYDGIFFDNMNIKFPVDELERLKRLLANYRDVQNFVLYLTRRNALYENLPDYDMPFLPYEGFSLRWNRRRANWFEWVAFGGILCPGEVIGEE